MRSFLLAGAALAGTATPAAAVTFINAVTVPGDATDLSAYGSTNANNRLGGFGSDLVYNASTGLYYGITDRGPGGGTIDYAPRIQVFSLDTNTSTGALSNFQLKQTIVFTDQTGAVFTGLNPTAANGSPSVLGRSFDPEGMSLLKNGDFLISDEYGPSVYEFSPSGQLVRTYQTPSNILPRQADGSINYTDTTPTITTGRAQNRGFEGLTVSNDGTKAYAVLQDPLVQDGKNNDGTQSRNVRIVQFDTATGQSTAQYVYKLEDIDDINARIPGTANDFKSSKQGSSIGVSSLEMLPNGQLAILERDNRGYGVDDPNATTPIGEKRIWTIDLTNATNVADVSLAGANPLPAGVDPVAKSAAPLVDIQALLQAAGVPVAEKMEGFSFGQWLTDGSLQLTVITDNDYSVTQNGSNVQFDVCSDGSGGSSGQIQVPLGSGCPAGTHLIPTTIYSFKLSAAEARSIGYVAGGVPEAATWAQLIVGFGLTGGALRRRAKLLSAFA